MEQKADSKIFADRGQVQGIIQTKIDRKKHMSTSITELVLSPGHIERLSREVAARENDDIATIPDTFGRLITGPPLLEGVYPISSRGSSSLTLPSADIFSIADHTFSEQRDELPV